MASPEAEASTAQHLDLPGRERERVRDISPSAVSAISTSTSSSVSAPEQYPSRPLARTEQPDLVISSQIPSHAADRSPILTSPPRGEQPEPVPSDAEQSPYDRGTFDGLAQEWPSESSGEQQMPSNRSSFSPESTPSDTRDVEGTRYEREFANEAEGYFPEPQELLEGEEFGARAAAVAEAKQPDSQEGSDGEELDAGSDGNSMSSDEDDKLGTSSLHMWIGCFF